MGCVYRADIDFSGCDDACLAALQPQLTWTHPHASCFQMIQITYVACVCAIFSNTFSGREDNSSTLSPVYHDTANQTGCGVLLIRVKYILESL